MRQCKSHGEISTSPTTTNITRDPIYMWSSLADVSSGAPRQRIAPLSIWYGRGLQVWGQSGTNEVTFTGSAAAAKSGVSGMCVILCNEMDEGVFGGIGCGMIDGADVLGCLL
jgi:hypothetical protein